MKNLLACLVCFSMVPLAGAGGAGKAPKIEGTWTVVGGSADGKKFSAEQYAKLMMVVTLKEGKFSWSVMGKDVAAGDYKMDATKLPVQIDKKHTSGGDKGMAQVGILKLEGDTLTIAVS